MTKYSKSNMEKCQVCGLEDKLKPSYFNSFWDGERRAVMTCTLCYWGESDES